MCSADDDGVPWCSAMSRDGDDGHDDDDDGDDDADADDRLNLAMKGN